MVLAIVATELVDECTVGATIVAEGRAFNWALLLLLEGVTDCCIEEAGAVGPEGWDPPAPGLNCF